MEIETTATTDVTEVAVSVTSDVSSHGGVFGTRPQTGRPHSISLFGQDQSTTDDGASASLELLLGVGVGAMLMYYLDPDGGPRRRALVRDKVVGAVTMAPDVFEATAHDVRRWARDMTETQGRRLQPPARHAGAVNWTPAARLAAGAVGGALTLLAVKRHDALGAAIGLLGSALLARGATPPARRAESRSEVSTEPVARELGDTLERSRLLEEV